jgi:hypothetical protein
LYQGGGDAEGMPSWKRRSQSWEVKNSVSTGS